MENLALKDALARAEGEINLYHIQTFHGLKCPECNQRHTTTMGDGQYYCHRCRKKFYFKDWYLKLIKGPITTRISI